MLDSLLERRLSDIGGRFENDMPRVLRKSLQNREIDTPLARRQVVVTALRVADVQSYRIEG